MYFKTIGFVGAGRVTSIMLGGFAKAHTLPERVVVCDPNEEAVGKLRSRHPNIETAADDKLAASQDIVFIAVHPPVVKEVLTEILPAIKPNTILVSLAPKLNIVNLTKILGGFRSIVRMIPNAPSIIGCGYNPIVFSETIPQEKRSDLLKILEPLGDCPVVAEQKLEAYAVLTAMGPTYLWFQLYELCRLGESFGLAEQEVQQAIVSMTKGTVETMISAGLTAEEVMDLIPIKPLGDEEENIKRVYRSKLEALYQKLTAADK